MLDINICIEHSIYYIISLDLITEDKLNSDGTKQVMLQGNKKLMDSWLLHKLKNDWSKQMGMPGSLLGMLTKQVSIKTWEG